MNFAIQMLQYYSEHLSRITVIRVSKQKITLDKCKNVVARMEGTSKFLMRHEVYKLHNYVFSVNRTEKLFTFERYLLCFAFDHVLIRKSRVTRSSSKLDQTTLLRDTRSFNNSVDVLTHLESSHKIYVNRLLKCSVVWSFFPRGPIVQNFYGDMTHRFRANALDFSNESGKKKQDTKVSDCIA